MKGFGHIFTMMGKYKSSWSREVIELDLHFKRVILLNITHDWTDSTPNYNDAENEAHGGESKADTPWRQLPAAQDKNAEPEPLSDFSVIK